MLKEVDYTITSTRELARGMFEMKLAGDTSAIVRPGQFADLAVEGKYLRRPISVCDRTDGSLTLVYKVVGEGTAILSRKRAGESVNALTGLGNGFDVSKAHGSVALVGGGAGLPPLYLLCKELVSAGIKTTVLAGFATAAEVYYADEMAALTPFRVATADGSRGEKGFVTELLKNEKFDYFYACGPEPMLGALVATGMDGQLSYEARMGCGFGVCMGCTCKTKLGNKRICTDGPVMTAEEMR